MKIWLRRVVALVLIAMGIALVSFQYNNVQSGSIDKETVKLRLQQFVDTELLETQFSGIEMIDVNGLGLNEEDYPCLWNIFNYLDEEWLSDSCGLAEWESFQELVLKEQSDTNLIIFRGVLSSCIKIKNKEKVVLNFLGEQNLDLQELSEKDLSHFPAIQKILKELEAGTLDEKANSVSLKEWDKMVDLHLESMFDLQCFIYNNKVYGPEFGFDYEVKECEFTSLSIVLKTIGILFLMLGLIVIRKLYTRKRGIMVNPQKIAILYDLIILLLAVPSAWLVASLLLEKLLFIPPIYAGDEMFFMGVFFFCFGIPFVSLFTSRLTSQSVAFDSKGIFVDSLRNKEFMKWESIQTIEFSDEYVLVGRLGTPIPTKLQKSLKLIDNSGNSILINEPQLKSVKKRIVQHFENNVPAELKANFMKFLGKW